MDKVIEKKKGWKLILSRKALPYWLGALVLAFVLYLVFRQDIQGEFGYPHGEHRGVRRVQ